MTRIILAALIILAISNPLSAHMEFTGASASVGTCGASPSIAGNDNIGTVTIGTGVVTACTVTFANAYTNTPVCVIVPGSTANITGLTSVSTTAFVAGFSASAAGGTFHYICFGRQS